MFGFPVNLQDSGVQKFTNDADSGFPKIQQREVFYSVKDGSWSDSTTWQTASGRVGKLPGQFDDVYVRHSVGVVDTTTINNCYISKELLWAAGARTLTINGNLFVSGLLSLNNNNTSVIVFGSINCIGSLSMTANSTLLRLYSEYNYINPDLFISGVGDIQYSRVGNQNILPLSYNRLTINGSGTKPLARDTTILSNLTVDSNNGFGASTELQLIFDLGDYDFTVNGTTLIANTATIVRPTSKNILFIGLVAFQGGALGNNTFGSFNFFGNPNVEFRGGISNSNANVILNTGTGTFSFTTNNQTIATSSSNVIFGCKMSISNGITLTITGTGGIGLNDYINGSNSLSKLTNSSTINFRTQTAAENSMTTGIVDFTTSVNTIGYVGNYTATIPSRFPTFHNLTISGTGTKTLSVNTTLNGNLVVSSTSNLELSTYNFSVNGTTTIGGSSQPSGLLSKNGGGNLLFVGLVNSQVNTSGQKGIDFSGNPSVELRGGLSFYTINSINSGTGTWTFTTNNQTIDALASLTTIFTCDFIISGAIQVRFRQGTIGVKSFNGTSASSTLILGDSGISNSTMNFTTSTIMTTGILNNTTNQNIIGYIMPGNYTIPITTFSGMQVGGGGIKTLSGNTTLSFNYFNYDQTTTLELSTYNFTVNGISGSASTGFVRISKNGSGNVLFVGKLVYQYIDFSIGNPSVELRNGFDLGTGGSPRTFKTGTGTWSFTTNNQVIDNYLVETYDCAISIASGITLQINKQNNLGAHTFNGVVNGVSSTSKLLMFTNAQIIYSNATQPMATGILDTSTNLNTFIYGNSNQDIKGGPTTLAKQVYRNLTLNGGGTKTLQGYVSVLNTYTLTSPATLNNNGYTLTNP